jgi:betaine-aldehyde dehydrogenase
MNSNHKSYNAAMQNKLFIGGRWVEATGGTLEVVNPSNEQVLHFAPKASPADIDIAVEAARVAFKTWKLTTGAERAVFLRAIAEGIRNNKEDLARLETMQNGKPLPEALWDMDDVAACFDYYAGLAEDLDQRLETRIALPHPDFSSLARLEPVGVVAQIIPWNYPLLMLAWKVAPALAAGCCSVLKPSELTPLTALELGRSIRFTCGCAKHRVWWARGWCCTGKPSRGEQTRIYWQCVHWAQCDAGGSHGH